MKQTSMKTHFIDGHKHELNTENPLKKKRKKAAKTRQEKIREFY